MLVRGAYDMHVHIAPDTVERRIDDVGLARRCRELGLAGFQLKSHYTSTAERASVVRGVVPEVEVFGAVTLNRAVGGMNPLAVEIAAREAEVLEDRLLQAEMLRELGETSKALGNAADARLAWREAAESFEGLDARHEAAEINALLASLPAQRTVPVPSWRRSNPPRDEGFSPNP